MDGMVSRALVLLPASEHPAIAFAEIHARLLGLMLSLCGATVKVQVEYHFDSLMYPFYAEGSLALSRHHHVRGLHVRCLDVRVHTVLHEFSLPQADFLVPVSSTFPHFQY